MPDETSEHRHEEEGWGVHEGGGFALAGALYALAFLGITASAVLFGIYFQSPPRPWPQPFPQPRLNGRIDRDPEFSYAPQPPPSAAIDGAMRALAAQGDAGWGPQAGAAPARRRRP